MRRNFSGQPVNHHSLMWLVKDRTFSVSKQDCIFRFIRPVPKRKGRVFKVDLSDRLPNTL